MYSWEIQQKMENHNYDLPSFLYGEILKDSPQINHVKFEPYGNYFEMWTTDGAYWKFNVHPEE